MGDGLAHPDILKCLHILRQADGIGVVHRRQHRNTVLDPGVERPVRVRHGQVKGHVQVAVLIIQHHGGLFRVIPGGNGADLRRLAPVVGLGCIGGVGAGDVLLALIGAGTHGLVPEIFIGAGLRIGFAQNRGVPGGQVVQARPKGLVSHQGQCLSLCAALFKIKGIHKSGPAGILCNHAVEGVQSVFGGHLLSIGEIYVIPELDHQGAVIGVVPALRNVAGNLSGEGVFY